ncbi:DUF1566 domain-containing protein [Crenothrix sp.]|uniref:Lcl C-terminal domain-containing protein n=1 Tax=Crenothrix sp. TaxID=3100433 RepID=UPI00374CB123
MSSTIIRFAFTLYIVILTITTAHALPANGKSVDATQISLQGGSNSSVQWLAPAPSTYKIWLQVPPSSTASNAKYRLYLKGNRPGNRVCTSKDVSHPCFEVTINQAANPGKWLLLAQNNAAKIIDQWKFAKGGYVSVNARNISPAQQLGIAAISFEDRVLSIGKRYGGGIIFYVDRTGKHGLIAAPTDQSTGLQWYNDGFYSNTHADKTSVGTGKTNTAAIIKSQGVGFYAATLCDRLVLGGYSDWFLPSKNELALMYKNIGKGAAAQLTNIGKFTTRGYWSSSEYNNESAWYQSFADGHQDKYDKYGGFAVRAVRAF